MSDEKKRVTVALTEELNRKLREVAKERGLSMSAILTLALEEYFNK